MDHCETLLQAAQFCHLKDIIMNFPINVPPTHPTAKPPMSMHRSQVYVIQLAIKTVQPTMARLHLDGMSKIKKNLEHQ